MKDKQYIIKRQIILTPPKVVKEGSILKKIRHMKDQERVCKVHSDLLLKWSKKDGFQGKIKHMKDQG